MYGPREMYGFPCADFNEIWKVFNKGTENNCWKPGKKSIYACKEARFHYVQFKNSKNLIIFGHFLYQIFSNPRKNVENTENFIYVTFIVTIFTRILNAQRRCLDISYAEFYIKWK